jgi:hypothetical protein
MAGFDGPPPQELTPSEFYFCGYVKQTVYSARILNIRHLKQRIGECAEYVAPDVLGRVRRELERRSDVCRAPNGAHIELRCTRGKKTV